MNLRTGLVIPASFAGNQTRRTVIRKAARPVRTVQTGKEFAAISFRPGPLKKAKPSPAAGLESQCCPIATPVRAPGTDLLAKKGPELAPALEASFAGGTSGGGTGEEEEESPGPAKLVDQL